MPKNHTPEEMIQKLLYHFEKTLELPVRGKWSGSPSSSAIIRTFGSWSQALRKAGIDKDGLRKEKLIAEMQKTVSDLGGIVPSANDWGRNCYKPSSTFLVKIFGTWNNALLAAGLTPKPEMKSSVTEEDVLTAFKNYVEQYKIRPKVDDWREKDLQPSYTEIIGIYGTWDDALRIIELNVNATGDECLLALRNFEEEKEQFPSVREWNDCDYWPSSSQIIRIFGTWNKAQQAARGITNETSDTGAIDADQKNDKIDIKDRDNQQFNFLTFQSSIYSPYLNHSQLLTIKEFVHELKLPIEYFRVDEYWDAWKNPGKFCVVDKGLLDYLGYTGTRGHQREAALKNLQSKFRPGIDFIYQNRLEAILVIGAERQPERGKVLAVSYPCLLQWQMSIQTDRGDEIRRQAAAQQMLFRIYLEYQTDWQIRQQQIILESKNQLLEASEKEITKLKKTNARYEKKHDYVKFNIEDAAYYVFSYGRRCQKDCILNHLRKHGIAIRNKKGSGPLDKRLKTHRTTFKWLTLELIIVAPPECIEALEKSMEAKFGANLNPNSSEVFEQLSLMALKETAISLLNVTCPDKYQIISQETIDAYNHDVDLLIKEGIEPIEEEENEIEKDVKKDKNESMNECNDEKHPTIHISTNPSFSGGHDNSVNVNVNIQVDLSELRSLLKDLETFTNKKLDSLLNKYDIPKHGNKDKKIEKLKTYINSKISEGAAIANKFGT